MTHPLNPAMAATEPPPVMEARRWLADASFTPARPLLNVSQAAPVDPPPLALRQATPPGAFYPVLGQQGGCTGAFAQNHLPRTGDLLQAWGRCGVSGKGQSRSQC